MTTNTDTDIHMNTHTHTRSHIVTHTRTCTHTHLHVHIYLLTHTYVRAHTHTHLHVHIYSLTHVHTPSTHTHVPGTIVSCVKSNDNPFLPCIMKLLQDVRTKTLGQKMKKDTFIFPEQLNLQSLTTHIHRFQLFFSPSLPPLPPHTCDVCITVKSFILLNPAPIGALRPMW